MLTIPHLESDITMACQCSCSCCNHLVPLYRAAGVWSANVSQVERDLNHLASILHTPVWGALGGEPTLHKGLVDILRVARDSQVSDKLEVWTNGIILNLMKPDFWLSFDILVLSIYPGKIDDIKLSWIKSKCADYGIELVIKDERTNPNFRTLLEPIPTDAESTRAKFAGCFFRQFSRVANNGFFYTCCCAPHMPRLLQGREEGADGVQIEGLTEEGLLAYLERTEPLGACTICAGRDTAVPVEWREERDPDKWIAASKGI